MLLSPRDPLTQVLLDVLNFLDGVDGRKTPRIGLYDGGFG